MKWYHYLGLILALTGQTLRTVAQLTAGSSFTHQIATYKRLDHILVTSGIYRYLRHPSYTGFFYWGVGLQLMMFNPVCFLGYSVALWVFFKDRIEEEEQGLVLIPGIK
ncbi:hypothetical protein HK096_008912 [Nowakowskiella sp. JEL0078]|nr:hypothetical protein HK096_008912 [Nowakowskiella sp. JEL0078]